MMTYYVSPYRRVARMRKAMDQSKREFRLVLGTVQTFSAH